MGSKAGRLWGPVFVSATGLWHRLWQALLAALRSAHPGDGKAAPPWTARQRDTDRHPRPPQLLPDSPSPLCPDTWLVLTRAPSSRLRVEECRQLGPSRAQLSAWHRPRSAGTSLRISLSWANTASPALQIPLSSFPLSALPAELC